MSIEPYVPRFVSMPEAAALLGLSVTQVQELIDSGQLRATAKQQRIKISDLRAFRSRKTATEVPTK